MREGILHSQEQAMIGRVDFLVRGVESKSIAHKDVEGKGE